jgi:DNA-binding MurR/RpiR family transcriptional regulator
VKSRKEAEPLRNIDPNVPFRHDTGIDEIISSLPLIYQRAVGFTRIAMNRNTIIRCVERIQQSNVMIFGTGINHLLAETFNYKLEELGMTCKVFDAFHYQYCVSMKKKNARLFAIVLTHSGRNAGMLMVIDRLIEYNIPYVVISGMLTENLKERGSEVIPIIPVSKSRELSNIQYMMSTQYILDILYVALLVKNMKMVENVDEKLNTGKGGNNHAV